MIHSHVFVKDALITDKMIPCGALEEVNEIMKLIYNNGLTSDFSINLKGHGSISFASNIDYFNKIEYNARVKI